jgi:hypothetical protein
MLENSRLYWRVFKKLHRVVAFRKDTYINRESFKHQKEFEY